MNIRPIALVAILVSTACYSALVAAEPAGFDGAKWIWQPVGPGETVGDYPGGAAYFRASVTLPDKVQIVSADIQLAADNLYVVYLNGRGVGESFPNPDAWRHAKRFNVTKLVAPGRNLLAVEGVNTAPGPAGLIVKLTVRLADGRTLVAASDGTWKCNTKEVPSWNQPACDDSRWPPVTVVGEFGTPPWGRFGGRPKLEPAREPTGTIHGMANRVAMGQMVSGPRSTGAVETPPVATFAWPEAIAFVGEDCSLYRPWSGTGTSYDSLSVTIFNPRKARTYPEHDLPAPMKVGRKLLLLRGVRPGVKPTVLLDAGRGALGSPSASFDGRWIYVSMARDGEPFFHIYRVATEGGPPQRLTDGAFHDIDPTELPDGRIVFTSTRIGTFEEYHNPPSRALFVMTPEGRDIRPLTNTIIFDNQPAILADGRIVFVRSDNFFDRGKVETMLHAIHPDGTVGYTEFGLEMGPEYGGRLRAYNCGCPAPMPDGRLAFVSGGGITVGRPGAGTNAQQQIGIAAGDVAAMNDGRLLCTISRRVPVELTAGKQKRTVQDDSYEKIAVLNLQEKPPSYTVVFDSPGTPLHSPIYVAPRTRPPLLPETVDRRQADNPMSTGVFFCQNARLTKNTTAGWQNVRAIRVLAGKGLTTRSSHSYIVHAGNETVDLGTVPLAPDGSFAVEVPADTAIAFQVVDAEGRSELNEMSWIYVRPGERRGCVGCHATRQGAPRSVAPMMQAMQTRPLRLSLHGQSHRFRGNNPAVTGLMELQFDRFREVAGINRHGQTTDPLATGADEVAALAAQLAAGDAGQRTVAAQRMAIFRDRTAAPALAGRLQDPSREVRVAAAMALAACGTRNSAGPLLAALEDADPLVAQAAAVALENLTGHVDPFNAFAPRKERMLQADRWSRWFEGTNWNAIEQGLVERLADDDRDVVRRAAAALGHVGSEAARTALRDYVTRRRGDNPFPAWRKDGSHHGDGARFNSLADVNPRTIQAATRSLGWLKDAASVPMLAETIRANNKSETGNLFLAEAAVESLGRIATPEAEAALIDAMTGLQDYPRYTSWYGDHGALMACHASPVHYLITEALDAMGSAKAGSIVPHLIRSVPTDPDRALLLESDDCETLIGRVIRRSGQQQAVVETCLAVLGDTQAVRSKPIEEALAMTHGAWGGKPEPDNRAAQILSLVCRNREFEPRLRAALDRYRATATDIPRVFDHGIPVVLKLPAKNWVCFFLARTLGNLSDPRSTEGLIAALGQSPAEAASGYPDPLGPGVLFLHNDLTPCWRAAVAWALGRIGDRRAVPVLLATVQDQKNAPDTRHAAAVALQRIAAPESLASIQRLAENYPDFATRRVLLKTVMNLRGGG